MNNKYELTDEKKTICGITFRRIRALRNIPRFSVTAGDFGGWIERESNLSQSGDAWVFGDAKVSGDAEVYGDAKVSGDAEVYGYAEVYGNAWVFGDAKVYGDAWVFGDAEVSGDAKVYGYAWVFGNAKVYGDAWVFGDAKVSGDADYMTFKNSWSSGRPFTYTRSNKMWTVGCFYGTGEELVRKAYANSEVSGKCYEAIVRAVEAIEAAKAEAKGETK